jgi:alanyl aminopeptidase
VLPLPEAKKCPDWLYPNAEGAGYLRAQVVGKGAEKRVAAAVPHLTRAERVAMLGDTLALARAGTLPAADALSLVPRFAQETDPVVLSAAVDLLEVMDPKLLPEARLPERARFMRDTFAQRALQLGLVPKPGEDEDTRLMRSSLTRLAGQSGQEAHLVGQARALAEKWLVDPRLLPQESVDPVLAIAASTGDAALHGRMLEAFKTQENRRVRQQLMFGLGSFRDPALVRGQLELLLDPAVDPREAGMLLFLASGDVRTRDVVYGFVKEHYDTLARRLPEDARGALVWVGHDYCDAEHRADLAAFFTERSASAPGGPRVLAQVLESVDLCMAMKAAQGASIEAFLAQPRKSGTRVARER